MWDDFLEGIFPIIMGVAMCVCGWLLWGHVHISGWGFINASAWVLASAISGWISGGIIFLFLAYLEYIPELCGWCGDGVSQIFRRIWRGLSDL